MNYKSMQRGIVSIDFNPSKGYEIKTRRPTLVMSRDKYNRSTNMVIVCPITLASKNRPYCTEVYA